MRFGGLLCTTLLASRGLGIPPVSKQAAAALPEATVEMSLSREVLMLTHCFNVAAPLTLTCACTSSGLIQGSRGSIPLGYRPKVSPGIGSHQA